MDTYLVSYDLYRPGQDYGQLLDAIKQLGPWWHYLDSTWIIKHSGPTSAIRDALVPYLDANDELLVVKLAGEGAWKGFVEHASSWLKSNL